MPKYEKRNTLTEVGSKQSEKEIWYKNSTKNEARNLRKSICLIFLTYLTVLLLHFYYNHLFAKVLFSNRGCG